MSDEYMSESEAEDFSVSEDEWLPGKKKGQSKQNGSEDSDVSNDSESLSEEESNNRRGKHRMIPKNVDPKKIIKKTLKTTQRTSKNNAVFKGEPLKRPRVDSESSGDEYLVDPNNLDLGSKFFDAVASNPSISSSLRKDAPLFDCNAGLGQLSDSSDDENKTIEAGDITVKQNIAKSNDGKRLVTKLNEMSQAYVNFQDYTKTLEKAKDQLNSITKKPQPPDNGETLDVSHLLALGETVSSADKKHANVSSKLSAKQSRKGAVKPIDSDSDWEEVEETASSGPSGGQSVQITLKPELTAQKKKKKCTEFDVEACIKRMINREKRDAQLVLHQMTIIMGIAHGNYTNGVLNHPSLLKIANGLIPSNRCYPKGRTNLQYFEQIMKYFREIVDLKDRRMFVHSWKRLSLEMVLGLQFLSQMANCKRDYILLFIVLLRSIGIPCRMVMSLQVVPKEVPNSELLKVVPSTGKMKVGEDKKENVKQDHDYGVGESKTTSSNRKRKSTHTAIPQLDGADDDTKGKKRLKQEKPTTVFAVEGTITQKKRTHRENSGDLKSQPIISISPRKTRNQRLNDQAQSNAKCKKEVFNCKNEDKARVKANKSSNNCSESPSTSKMIRKDYGDKKKMAIASTKTKSSSTKDDQNSLNISSSASSSKKIVKIERFGPKTRNVLDRRVLSTDDEGQSKKGASSDSAKPKPDKKVNLWIEVFSEEEEQWLPLDVTRGMMGCVEQIVQQASSPMLYVLAWNNDGSIKDVSARYIAEYLTVTQKLRIMQQWMDNTLLQFRGDRTARDIAEDRELNRILEERPLPRTISEYKNHPYFALKRHLLKFEAIYPPDAPTLGFTPGKEPVYARECVHTLHAREVWLKQARTVKLYETAYKIVSGRPKYDRASGQMLPSQPLELFGHWQTEEYDPPTAEGGIVPRNAYGNVELFKPCMLPKKTVHLRLPALNRICKKLHIDCAHAVTGFDFHGGSSHPVYDGFVVCEEFRDVVVDAWHEEQAAEAQRAREKYEKRVYGNWKRLIKGLLIRRKLQHKYNFDNLTQ